MTDRDDIINRVTNTLKEPVNIDAGLVDRVMSRVQDLPVPGKRAPMVGTMFEWLRRRRTIQLSPLGGLALAAGIAGVIVVGNALLDPKRPANDPGIQIAEAATIIQFVLVAPRASTVSLVGDFNDWNLTATPLVREDGDGVWSVEVPLTSGRYRYSFLIDGSTWLRDPEAAPAVEDEFGRPNSVVTVGEL